MTQNVISNSLASFKPRKMSVLSRREAVNGYLFISPWLFGFLVFTLFPTLATLGLSFTNFKLIQDPGDPLRFVGFENYLLLFKDPQVWASLLVTLKFAAVALPIGMILPLALALLLNSRYLLAKPFFRTMFYLPYIIPFVSAIYIWGGMLNPDTGWINRVLVMMGVQSPPAWTNDIYWVYPAFVILGIWGIGNDMLINISSLQGVPTELYDAAKVDGAGWWGTLFNVTLPMISPVIFYTLTLNIVGLFQYFLVPLVVTNGTGQPGGATMFFNLYLYKTFFTYQNMSYGATLAWFLFIIILAVTLVLFRTSKYWVFYAGDKR
jgi:multiple sugar transport system permease protein